MNPDLKPFSPWTEYTVETEWEHATRSVSKEGLFWLVRFLARCYETSPSLLLHLAGSAKLEGQLVNLSRAELQRRDDPDAYFETLLLRQTAAKKAARKRKKKGSRQ